MNQRSQAEITIGGGSRKRLAMLGAASLIGVTLATMGSTPSVAAAPRPNPTLTPFAAPGSITVPDGVCRVTAVVTGGFGGADTLGTHVLGGDGTTLTATYRVLPGEVLTYATANGGASGSAKGAGQNGANGGQAGLVRVGTQVLLVAGAGGGSGGDNASYTANHFGGDAGLPSTSAIAGSSTGNGQAGGTPGNSGQDGGGGGGGTASGGAGGASGSAGGSGGANGVTFATPSPSGGGDGGDAVSFAANIEPGGGGGGAGFSGGGGGGGAASSFPNVGLHMAGGGGGGSSFVSNGGTLITGARIVSAATSEVSGSVPHNANGYTAVANPALDQGTGGNSSATYQWHMCNYELGVAKSVSNTLRTPGSSFSYTITVTNNGPDNMSGNSAAVVASPAIPTDRDTVVVSDTDLPVGYTLTLPANCRSTANNGQFPVTCWQIPGRCFWTEPGGKCVKFQSDHGELHDPWDDTDRHVLRQ
jgi:uncharacterized repeat protein (TIGR01451 family)